MYQRAFNSEKKSEKIAIYNSIISELNNKVEKGFKNEDVYINYINSLYQLALLQTENHMECYKKASLAASIYVKIYPNSPLANYYYAKSLYLLEINDEKINKKIQIYGEKAINLMNDKRFAFEKKEIKNILKDINDNKSR